MYISSATNETFQYDTGVTYENGKDIPYTSYEDLAKQKRITLFFQRKLVQLKTKIKKTFG